MTTSTSPMSYNEGHMLLQLVANCKSPEKVDNPNILDEVQKWFDNSTEIEAQQAARETNDAGETALHILLKNNKEWGSKGREESENDNTETTLLDIVQKFVDTKSDVFSIQDSRGYLPLHCACEERSCSHDVIAALIEAYPPGLGVMSNVEKHTLTHSPFGWDYKTNVGGHFTEFLQYVVATDVHNVSASGEKTMIKIARKSRNRLLGHCKNWVPLDILKKGMLNEQTLESKAMIRWLNEIPCKRTLVCSMVFEFYLHIAWIYTFVRATWFHIEEGEQLQGWEPIALLVFAALFFMQEFYQMYRFIRTNASIAYWLDLWNWVDLTTSALVTASAIKFRQKDESVHNDYLLISTGFFMFVLLISYLKKTFFAFSKFVSGVIKIFWSLLPFLVISCITLFAFSFMYYVQQKDGELIYDPSPHDSPNPYATLLGSFETVFMLFAPGPLESNENILDFLYGISIVIVLLNVVIAVVSEAWEAASEEANRAFWNYRLDLILEKTRGISEDQLRPLEFCGCFRDLDEFYINIETVGTTTDELKAKLALTHREYGVFFCLIIIMKSLSFVVLGFPTFGFLWPKFFRQILFTPPKPKTDEGKMQYDHLIDEIAECRKLTEEGRARQEKIEANIAKYQKEVGLLSERLNAQNKLMQQLLVMMENSGQV